MVDLTQEYRCRRAGFSNFRTSRPKDESVTIDDSVECAEKTVDTSRERVAGDGKNNKESSKSFQHLGNVPKDETQLDAFIPF